MRKKKPAVLKLRTFKFSDETMEKLDHLVELASKKEGYFALYPNDVEMRLVTMNRSSVIRRLIWNAYADAIAGEGLWSDCVPTTPKKPTRKKKS